mmetsp:Transcript_998/g.1450  ORF Transcript_998/g.1450 Transcript_998/m.1450 type:complete len:104 (-) Transcript_998:953-1264(-)
MAAMAIMDTTTKAMTIMIMMVMAFVVVSMMAMAAMAVATFFLLQTSLADLHEDPLQGEGLNAKNKIHVDFGVLCPFHRGCLVDSSYLALDLVELGITHQVCLV